MAPDNFQEPLKKRVQCLISFRQTNHPQNDPKTCPQIAQQRVKQMTPKNNTILDPKADPKMNQESEATPL